MRWKLVPVEPTEEMRIEGLTGLCRIVEETNSGATDGPQRWMDLGAIMRTSRETNAAYAGYLSAAPDPAEDAELVEALAKSIALHWHPASATESARAILRDMSDGKG